MTLAVDISNYTSDLAPAQLQAWKDAGVGLVIAQAVNPPPGYPRGKTREQIQQCIDAGLAVDVYVWLWFDLDIGDIQRKLDLIDGLPIRQLWLDVEDTAAVKYDQATCESKVVSAIALCDRQPVTGEDLTGIYSGRWYWSDSRYMGNTTAFRDRELWDANYDDVADAALGFVPYGGWTAPRIKQYRGTSSLAGVSGVDLNVLSVAEESELGGTGGPSEPGDTGSDGGMEPPQCDWGWVSKKDLVVARAGELKAVAQQIRDAANRKYGPVRAGVLPLAEAVDQRADEILA